MLLFPKKTKYRYNFSTSYEGKAKGNSFLVYGDFGIRAKKGCYISNRSLEAARKAASWFVKKAKGKMWMRIFPQLIKTKKPLEVRMGSGKGALDGAFAVVKQGTFIIEVKGLDKKTSDSLFTRVNSKLPISCEMIWK